MASTSVVFDLIAKDRASDKFDHLGRSVGGSSSMLSKFTGVAKVAGKAAALALGAGLVLAVGAGVKFAKAAAEDAQAAELLKGALERNAGATQKQVADVEDWITAIGRAKGVADDDLRPALARLVTATHDVTQAQLLAQVAMDVSAGTGKSLESVSTALMKAQNGQVSSLSRLGINTKNAAGETITMSEAVSRMSDQFGGAASEKAETFQGKMDRLKLMLSETGEAIGYKLIPIGMKLMEWVTGSAIPGMERFAGWLEVHIVPVLKQVGDWISNTVVPAVQRFAGEMQSGEGAGGKFASALGKVKGGLEGAWGILKPLLDFMANNKTVVATFAGVILTVAAAAKVWAIAQGILNAVMIANPIGLVVVAVAALAAGLVYAYKKSETFRDVIDTGMTVISKAATFMWNKVYQPVLTFLIGAIGRVIEVFADMVDGMSHVPGFGWLGGVADKMHAAAAATDGLSNSIKKIPEHKTVTIDVQVNQSQLAKVQQQLGNVRGRAGAGGRGGGDPWGLGGNNVGGPGAALIESIVSGITKGKVKLQTALDKVKGYIQKHQESLTALLEKRAAIVDSFKGFASSIFGADTGFEASKNRQDEIASLNAGILDKQKALAKAQDDLAKATADNQIDAAAYAADQIAGIQADIAAAQGKAGALQTEDAAAPKGLDALLAFQSNQKAKAQGVLADVQSLIGKGISKELLTQLQGAGEAGEEQIHLLAGATAEQLAQANADNAATQAALQAAGLAASEAQGIEAGIRQEEANIKLAETIKGGLKDLLALQDENTIVELHLDGHVILASLKKIKRAQGGHLGLGDTDKD